MKTLTGCLLMILTWCAHAEKHVTVDVFSKEPKFSVTLEAEADTDYEWTLVDYDKVLFYFNGIEEKISKTGRREQTSFLFLLNPDQDYPASTTMIFRYAKPGDDDRAIVEYVTVNFMKFHYTYHSEEGDFTPFYDPLHSEDTFFSPW